MVNSVQQQVDAYESAGVGALQQMQKLDPKMVVGIALENLEQGLKADQRAKSMSNANVGPSVIDKKLMGLGGLGLGQQEALNTARPGTQIRGQQLQANQLAQAMQRAQKRPAGGIASMPMMRNQMRRMAASGGIIGYAPGGDVEDNNFSRHEFMYGPILRNLGIGPKYDFGGGLNEDFMNRARRRAAEEKYGPDAAMPVGKGQPIPMLMQKYGSEKVMEFLKKEKELKDIEGNVAPERIKDFEMMKANIESLFDPEMIRAIRRTRSGPDEVELAGGGEIQKYAGHDGSLVNDTTVDASRLRDLTPEELSEADRLQRIADRIEEERQAQARRDADKVAAKIRKDLARQQSGEISQTIKDATGASIDFIKDAGLGAISAGIDAGGRAIDYGLEALNIPTTDEERSRRMFNNMFPEAADAIAAETRDPAAAQNEIKPKDEQKFITDPSLGDVLLQLQTGPVRPEKDKTEAGLQPERTPMADKIFSFLETLGDFSGAPKGYEAATFLGRRRERAKDEADRQAQVDLLDRELEGRFDLMKEQERVRAEAARGKSLAEYAAEYLDPVSLSLSPEVDAERRRLRKEAGEGFLASPTDFLRDAEEEEIERQLATEFIPLLREEKLRDYKALLDAYTGSAGLPGIPSSPAVQEYSEYRPSTE